MKKTSPKTKTTLFGSLPVGAQFTIYITYARKTMSGKKVSPNDALIGGERGFVGSKVEVEVAA